jgi:methylenetetrahydrofolate--tRNA-(uracil-5-)-methyltransferase trmFO
MTGVEGYMESASSGLLAGRNAVRRLEGKAPLILPITTMMGSLAEHAAHSPSKDFQPMGANFGILPVIEPHIRDKKERYAALSARALEDLAETLKNA